MNAFPLGFGSWKHRVLAASTVVCIVIGGCSAGSSGGGGGSNPTPTKYPPIANAGGPYSGATGAAITFIGQGSTDPQGQNLTYAWSFGDGGTGAGANPTHAYATAGSYTVTLTVTNTSGLSASATSPVSVGALPIANPGGPYTAYVLTPTTLNGGASTDPQGLPLTYSWSFGDNGTGTGVAPTHTYGSYGSFKVLLTVTDSAGLKGYGSTTITIGYPPPTIVLNGPYTGRPTLPIQFTSNVTDIIDGSFLYIWQFGDGATSYVPNPTHAYATAGTYTVSLYAIGQYNESATVTTTATITAQTTGPALSGTVQSGSTPIIGAHVYLFAANTTGYAQPSVSLLSGTGTSDSLGSYVVSSGSGAFTLPAGFNCPTHEQVYVYASGGSVGGKINSSASLMAPLGACGYVNSGSSITVNEATTIAAAYGLSGYATSPTSISSPNTTAALTGIANGFLNAANLVSSTTGRILSTTPAGNGTPQHANVSTLANILNACVNSSGGGSAGCTTLFANAQTSGNTGTAPTDTATAAINIAHNQGSSVAALFALQTALSPFGPALSAAPHDWTIAISFIGGYQTQGLAVDASGDVWVLQYPTTYGTYPHLVELASNGSVLVNEDTNCSSGNVGNPIALAIAPTGNVFLLTGSAYTYLYTDPDGSTDEGSYGTAEYCVVAQDGTMLSPSGGIYLGGGQNTGFPAYNITVDAKGNALIPSTTLFIRSASGANLGNIVAGNAPYGGSVALDGAGDYWVTSPATNSIIELGAGLNLISPPTGYIGGGLSVPESIALDNAGNAWVIDATTNYANAGNSISKFNSKGIPAAGSPFFGGAITVPYSIAIDGGGNAWLANGNDIAGDNAVLELNPSGTVNLAITHPSEIREYLDGAQSIALDASGDVWVSDGLAQTVTEFVGPATPVVTPVSANLAAPYNAPASRP